MAHTFDPNNRQKLDSPERRENFPPDTILKQMGLSEGDVFLDVGCGTGYFSIPASRIVGASGKVIAYDLQPEMLNDLKTSINENEITNIDLLQGDAGDIPLEDTSITFAFMANVLHEVDNKTECLSRIHALLKNRGKIGIIDWRKIETDKGPPAADRLPDGKIEELLRNAGFEISESTTIADTHNSVVAVRND